jgi:vacuolar iron transporter family protein
VIAGSVPLVPYALVIAPNQLAWSIALTFATLFAVGAWRGVVTSERWWRTGFEMLMLGAVVAAAAYGAGAVVARLVATGPALALLK